MTLPRVVITGVALWLAAHLVDGVRLAAGLDPLATIGTVLLVALLLSLLHALGRGARRACAVLVEPLPFALVAVLVLDAALFWLAGAIASVAGLGYTVDGAPAAVLGSMLVLLAGWVSRWIRL